MKNKLLLLLIVATIASSCQKEKDIDYAILKGHIYGTEADSITLYNYHNDVIKKMCLKKDKSFLDTIRINERYYFLNVDNILNRMLFLKPAYDLNIEVKLTDDKNDISFSGYGGKENQYLQEKREFVKKLPLISPTSSNYAFLKEKEFVDIANSNYKKKMDFFKKYKDLDKDFVYMETKSIEYDRLMKLSFYEGNMKYLMGDEFKISSNFPDYYKNIDLSDEKLKYEHKYLYYVRGYLRTLAYKKAKNNPSFDKYTAMLNVTDSVIKNQALKDEICYNIAIFLEHSKKIDSAYQIFNRCEKNESYKKIIYKKYLKTKKIGKGDISPIFELYDINNKKVSLTDFKGSYVLIDIWNTYCKPCLIEMPKFEKIKKQFAGKNIQFISICTNSPKENWKNIVKTKHLTGIQLYAPDSSISFFKEFMFRSAPRFILIGKDGRIIEPFADRPSKPGLLNTLKKLEL